MGTWARGQTPFNSTAKLFYTVLLAMFVLFLIEIFDYDSENQYNIWVVDGVSSCLGSHNASLGSGLLWKVLVYICSKKPENRNQYLFKQKGLIGRPQAHSLVWSAGRG